MLVTAMKCIHLSSLYFSTVFFGGGYNQTFFWVFLQVQEFFGGSSNLQSTVVQVLWERFTGKRETSGLNRRAAVLLLGMAAR